MANITYRKELDGLRAIAVVAVILFHAGYPAFSGGFVGVDVFFVLSGYLITQILFTELQQHRFNLFGFWERRIRRIFPALTVVMVLALAAGWLLLLPADYINAAKQVLYQLAYSSNLLFYSQSGYFDSSSFTKPLLHTWSLALEGQFYLLMPLGFYLVYRFKKELLGPAIVLAAAVSFGLCVWKSYTSPSLAFFMFPTRVWEFLLGSIAVFYPLRTKARWQAEAATALGFALVVVPVFAFSKATLFPGWAAALPVAGAFLLIAARPTTQVAPLAHRLLGLRPVVFIGVISYSLYLYHWPLIVFAQYGAVAKDLANQPILLQLAIFAATLLLALASWKWVETPIRKKQTLKTPLKFWLFVATSYALLALGSYSLVNNQGFATMRFDTQTLAFAAASEHKNPRQKECNRPALTRINQNNICQTLPNSNQPPQFLLWGDSHADAIAPAFDALSKEFNLNGYVATFDGCPPLLGLKQRNRDSAFYCTEFNHAMLELVQRQNIKTVFLVGAWLYWFQSEVLYLEAPSTSTQHPTTVALAATLEKLHQLGVQVYVLHNIPIAAFDVPKTLAFHHLWQKFGLNTPTPQTLVAEYHNQRHFLVDALAKIETPVAVLDPIDIFCDATACSVGDAKNSFYYNGGHLSVLGALKTKPVFEAAFKTMQAHTTKAPQHD